MSKELTVKENNTQISISDDQYLSPISFHHGASLLPVEQQKKELEEYDNRRKHFLTWLFSHLKEGLHFGYPPGCECRYDNEGNLLNKSGGIIRPSQWIPKPSLYKSGALLIIDLLKLKPEYTSDMQLWEMAGNPKGTIFRKCALIDVSTNRVIGEGSGAYTIGSKKMDANAATKMADKNAAVAAVLNGVPVLGELFTQDIEKKQKERQKGNLDERRKNLLDKVTDTLMSNNSQWSGEISEWIQRAVVNLLGPNAKLTSKGALDIFEKAVDENRFDLDTAELKNA